LHAVSFREAGRPVKALPEEKGMMIADAKEWFVAKVPGRYICGVDMRDTSASIFNLKRRMLSGLMRER